MRCADCGVHVEKRGITSDGQIAWGSRGKEERTRAGRKPSLVRERWDFICRWEPGPEPGTVASADYHYVEGEKQRHFVAPEA